MTVPAAFALTGLIILVGFAGKALFEKTRIPDIPILLAIGVLLGPVLRVADTALLLPLAPYVGTLALLIIMFEGGMSLDADRVLRQMKWAFLLTLAAFLLTTAAVGGAYHLITGTALPVSLALGATLGCISGAIVIPLVQQMRMSENTRTILTLEAALEDALAVVSVLFLIQYILSPSLSLRLQLTTMANAFVWGGALGAGLGFIWVRILPRVGRMPLAYMLTMAVLLLLYAASEAIHSSGIFAVLVFGMAVSNAEGLVRRFRLLKENVDREASEFALHETIRWFHEEVTFVARVFFFVYLGMLLDVAEFSPAFAAAACATVALIYLARNLSVRIVGWLGRPQVPFERKILTGMAPRGLASAVLATLPAAAGIEGTEVFIQYAFVVIAATNLLLTVSVVRSERRLDTIIAGAEGGSGAENDPAAYLEGEAEEETEEKKGA